MKALIPILLIIIVVVGIVYFFKNKEENEVVENTEESSEAVIKEENTPALGAEFMGDFTVNTEKSTATWTGKKTLVKDYVDTGTIKITKGQISFKNGAPDKGEIEFNMNSIETVSVSNKRADNESQTKHLKSADFFEVETYPTATYKVTGSKVVEDGFMLDGVLTLKGKTDPLTVPVQVKMTDDTNMTMEGVVTIDRTNWDVRYGSDNFFDNLGDSVIDDNFTVSFSVDLVS